MTLLSKYYQTIPIYIVRQYSRNRKKWSPEEDQFIKDFYMVKGKEYCSDELERNPDRVYRRAVQLGVYIPRECKRG